MEESATWIINEPQGDDDGEMGTREENQVNAHDRTRLTLDRTFSRQVIFEKILTLPALEETPFWVCGAVVPSY